MIEHNDRILSLRAFDLDILFISSKGSQYRYFKALSKATRFKSQVVTLFPGLAFSFIGGGLTKEIINSGIQFHLERKRRKYTNGEPNRFIFSLYRCFSMFYFSLIYFKFKHVLSVKQPKVICIWNGHRLPEMAIKAAAEGLNIKIAHFENGLLPDTTVIDFNGVNAFSSIPKDKEFFEEYSKNIELNDEYKKPLLARSAHKKRKDLLFEQFDFDCEYIFVPFQVNFDSQVIINSPWVNSMEQLYKVIVNAVDQIQDKKLLFVVKEHPSDARSYTEFHCLHDRIKFVDENTEKLIENAKAVITLNSSVGIEAAMMDKGVIVLGNACYGVDGVTLVVSNENQLIKTINNLNKISPDKSISRAFFNYLERDYLLPVAWQKCTEVAVKDHIDEFDRKISEKLI